MPVYLDPNAAFPVCLDADKDKAPRPTFWCRVQSMRGQQQIAATLDALFEEGVKTADLLSQAVEEIERVVVRVENLPDFTADCLTYQEARELLQKIMYNQSLDHDTKKD